MPDDIKPDDCAAVHTSCPYFALIECTRAHLENPRDHELLREFEKNVLATDFRLKQYETANLNWRRPKPDVTRERLFRFYDAVKDKPDRDRREGLCNATFWLLTPEFYETEAENLWTMLANMEGPSFINMRGGPGTLSKLTQPFWVPFQGSI